MTVVWPMGLNPLSRSWFSALEVVPVVASGILEFPFLDLDLTGVLPCQYSTMAFASLPHYVWTARVASCHALLWACMEAVNAVASSMRVAGEAHQSSSGSSRLGSSGSASSESEFPSNRPGVPKRVCTNPHDFGRLDDAVLEGPPETAVKPLTARVATFLFFHSSPFWPSAGADAY